MIGPASHSLLHAVLRRRLNALCEAANAPMQFTGIGSMLSVHMMRGPIRSPADAARGDARLKELFFFDMLAHGIWLARRGMMALSLPIGDRVELMLHNLKQIYPELDLRRHIIGEPITMSWEANPNFMGAFKGNLPGHYRYQYQLFSHFIQDRLPPHQRGIFVVGDDISWTAGWTEGAVTTALNAVSGLIRHFGGSAPGDNPGPCERWAELAPLKLPD